MEDYTKELIVSNENDIVFEESVEVVGEDIIADNHADEIIVENGYQEDEIDVCNEDIDDLTDNNYHYDIDIIDRNDVKNVELYKINHYDENNVLYPSDDKNDDKNDDDLPNDLVYDNIEIENDVDNADDLIIKNNEFIDDNDNHIDNNFDKNNKLIDNSTENMQNKKRNGIDITEVNKTSSNAISNFKLRHRKTNQLLKNSFQNSNNLKSVKIIWQHRNKPLNTIKPTQLQNIDKFIPSHLKHKFSFKRLKNNSLNNSDNESDVRRNRGRPKKGEFVPPVFKVTDCQPLDIAAHLNLLSNSLSNIGSKLIIQKGQVSVDDSVSILLDSLVCVLCSLLPLTSQIDPLKDHSQKMKERHLELLDNIAYIMPGVTK